MQKCKNEHASPIKSHMLKRTYRKMQSFSLGGGPQRDLSKDFHTRTGSFKFSKIEFAAKIDPKRRTKLESGKT